MSMQEKPWVTITPDGENGDILEVREGRYLVLRGRRLDLYRAGGAIKHIADLLPEVAESDCVTFAVADSKSEPWCGVVGYWVRGSETIAVSEGSGPGSEPLLLNLEDAQALAEALECAGTRYVDGPWPLTVHRHVITWAAAEEVTE